MKVKRYFASNMRSALDLIKQEQGPDVLILSNRKVDGGVELLIADEASREEAASFAATQQVDDRPVSIRPANGNLLPSAAGDAASLATRQAQFATKPPLMSSAGLSEQEVLWTDAGTVAQMRNELSGLKQLLESQLPGLAWADFGNRHPVRARLLRVLHKLGIAPSLSRDLIEEVPDELAFRDAWHRALALLAMRLNVADNPILQQGGKVSLLGPTGVGKSTLISKLAARTAVEHGPDAVAIVSLDDRRLGAHQQLTAFGRLIGSAVYTLRNMNELRTVLDNLDRRRLVLIDTPGSVPGDQRFIDLVGSLYDIDPEIRSYSVLSACTDYLATTRVLDVIAGLPVDGCILTKLDEAATLGPSLSAIIESQLPLAYTSAGQRVPDDLETVETRSLIERAVELARSIGETGDSTSIEQVFA